MPKISSTKGKHIQHHDVLPKGEACLSCKARKVRCSGGAPACAACLRTAQFEGRDLSTVRCDYSQKKTKSRASSKKSSASVTSSSRSSPAVEDDFQIKLEHSVDELDQLAQDMFPLEHPINYAFSSSSHFPSTFDPRSDSYFSDASSSSWASGSSNGGSPMQVSYALPPLEPTGFAPPPNSPYSQIYFEMTVATPVSHATKLAISRPLASPNPFETSFGEALETKSFLALTTEALYGQRTPNPVDSIEAAYWDIVAWEASQA